MFNKRHREIDMGNADSMTIRLNGGTITLTRAGVSRCNTDIEVRVDPPPVRRAGTSYLGQRGGYHLITAKKQGEGRAILQVVDESTHRGMRESAEVVADALRALARKAEGYKPFAESFEFHQYIQTHEEPARD